MTQDQLAQAIGVHVNTIGKFERGSTSPDAKLLLDMGACMQVNPAWLLVGDATAQPSVDRGGGVELVSLNALDDQDGCKPHMPFGLPRPWIASRRLNAAKLVTVVVHSDSMEPTVRQGDILVLDQSETKMAGDGLHVIKRDGEKFCKRLQRQFDGGLTIMSDNPRYESQQLSAEVAATLSIVGRVIWVGGER